jgi:hypothetical protein
MLEFEIISQLSFNIGHVDGLRVLLPVKQYHSAYIEFIHVNADPAAVFLHKKNISFVKSFGYFYFGPCFFQLLLRISHLVETVVPGTFKNHWRHDLFKFFHLHRVGLEKNS